MISLNDSSRTYSFKTFTYGSKQYFIDERIDTADRLRQLITSISTLDVEFMYCTFGDIFDTPVPHWAAHHLHFRNCVMSDTAMLQFIHRSYGESHYTVKMAPISEAASSYAAAHAM